MFLLLLFLCAQPVQQSVPQPVHPVSPTTIPQEKIPPEKIAPAEHDPLTDRQSRTPEKEEPTGSQRERMPK